MKAFLHIGTEKTGTTTIQNFLAQNRKQLLEDGYLYPSSPGKTNHIKLAIFAMKSTEIQYIHRLLNLTTIEQVIKYQSQFKKKLAQELTLTKFQAVIMSSEHCSSQLICKEDIERLKILLNDFFEEIKIIIYLRRQDQYWASLYSTSIRCGHTKSFDLPSKNSYEKRYDYYSILKKWASVFEKSNIIVKIFERAQMLEGDLLKDFTNTLDLKLDSRYNFTPNANKSLDIYSLEYLRIINLSFQLFLKNNTIHNRYRRKIVDSLFAELEKYSNGNKFFMPEIMAESFMSNFHESNKQVAQEFLDRPDGKLFNKDFAKIRRKEVSKLITFKKLFKITMFVLKEKLKNKFHYFIHK